MDECKPLGAGLNTESNTIFFTKNGERLGVAFQNVCVTPLYPTIGRAVQVDSNKNRIESAYGCSAET